MEYHGLVLDTFQEEAIQHLRNGESVLVSAPTGAGKTLIAEFLLEQALAQNFGIVYTAPLKALSNQKFRDFQDQYGDRIGIVTGDVSIRPQAPVLIMTTEIFRNRLLEEENPFPQTGYVIFDEIHYMADEERGTVWEESLIFCPPRIKILGLSATVPNVSQLADWMESIRNEPVHVVHEDLRPVPLSHHFLLEGLGLFPAEKLKEKNYAISPEMSIPLPVKHSLGKGLFDYLQEQDLLPCLYFCFNRRYCQEKALANRHRELLTKEQSRQAKEIFEELATSFGVTDNDTIATLRPLAERGIAFHHAGLLPTAKEIVERLFTTGLLKLVFATETFAMGINMPARSVVFDTLHKWNGTRMGPLKTIEYFQMAGRAGRRGMDERGYVFSFTELNERTVHDLDRIIAGRMEYVDSQFNLSYSTICSLFSRLGKNIFTACDKSFAAHELRRRSAKTAHSRRRKGRNKKGPPPDPIQLTLRAKLGMLQKLGYLDQDKVFPRGTFATYINGYELQTTELFFGGIMENLTPLQLVVLFMAIVFESKRTAFYAEPEHDVSEPFRRRALKVVRNLMRLEKSFGIREPVPFKLADFRFTAPTLAFARGISFSQLEQYTDASDGDKIRSFRLTIQLLRQFHDAIAGHDSLRARVKEAVRLINRDEIDAERTLRRTTSFTEGQEDPAPAVDAGGRYGQPAAALPASPVTIHALATNIPDFPAVPAAISPLPKPPAPPVPPPPPPPPAVDHTRFLQPRSVLVYPLRDTSIGRQYLLLHRNPGAGNFWQGVTGGIRWDESWESAAARELVEETGFTHLRLEPADFSYRFPIPAEERHLFPSAAIEIEERVYLAWVEGSAFPVLDEQEHDDWKWTCYQEALQRLKWPNNIEALKFIEERLSQNGF